MKFIRKRDLSCVTTFYFRKRYGIELAKRMVGVFNAKKKEAQDAAIVAASAGKKTKVKKPKKDKSVKRSKPGFVFLFSKNVYLPLKFSRKRISVYNGKAFFSFIVHNKYVYTRLSEFIVSKKFGREIHKKIDKKKKVSKKK